jgi:hypothetical protein
MIVVAQPARFEKHGIEFLGPPLAARDRAAKAQESGG